MIVFPLFLTIVMLGYILPTQAAFFPDAALISSLFGIYHSGCLSSLLFVKRCSLSVGVVSLRGILEVRFMLKLVFYVIK